MSANRHARRAAASDARANPHRGEALLVADGQAYKLKLTLNALVEIEEAFGCGIGEVAKKLNAGLSMKDLRSFLGPLVRGGGAELSDVEIGALPFDMRALSTAIGEVMRNNLAGDAHDEAPASGN